MVGLCTMKGHCTGERHLPFGARPQCDVAITTFKKQPAFEWHARARHCARCLSRGGAARKLAARARRAAPVVVGLGRIQGHCTSEKPLSFGARPWYDVPATASNAKSAAAREPSAHAPALAVSREIRRSTRACCARAPCRDGCGRLRPYARALHQREASLLRCAAMVRHASYRLQRQAGCRA